MTDLYIYPSISRLFVIKTSDITYPSYIPFKYFLDRYFLAMEIFELGEKKKAFAHPKERYKNPFKEALKVR